jgi:uncharacterized protein
MIDCDVHCAPASWQALDPHLAPEWRKYVEAGRIVLTGRSGGPSHAYPLAAPTSVTASAREAPNGQPPATYEALKQQLLDRSDASHVILNCLTMFDAARNPYYQAGLAAALNNWLREEWLDKDERLRAGLVVPWIDPDSAVAEIERAGDDPRFVHVVLPIRAPAHWGQKIYHRMYAAAIERGLAIALHAWGLPEQAATVSGSTTTYVEDYLSNATIVQQHIASLVAEGVFARFPDVRVVLLECGFAWLPSLEWRLDKYWKTFWPEIPWVKETPSDYVQRSVRVTTTPADLGDATPRHVSELVDMIGANRLMFASDYPHDHGPSGQRLLDILDAEAKEAVVGGNAAAFYELNDRN